MEEEEDAIVFTPTAAAAALVRKKPSKPSSLKVMLQAIKVLCDKLL